MLGIILHIPLKISSFNPNFKMCRFLRRYCVCFLIPFLMLVGPTYQERIENSDCISGSLHLLNTTIPVDSFALPASFAAASLPQGSSAQLQIHNTLALYPLAIDSKNFAALSQVFTCDIVANYSAPLNVIAGLSNVQTVLNQSLHYVTTQHSFATQIIDVLAGGREAKTLTYFTATHFGQGAFVGQVRSHELQEL